MCLQKFDRNEELEMARAAEESIAIIRAVVVLGAEEAAQGRRT